MPETPQPRLRGARTCRRPSEARIRRRRLLLAAITFGVLSGCGGTPPSASIDGSGTAGPPTASPWFPESTASASAPTATLVAPPAIQAGQLQLTCGSPLAFPPAALSGPPGAEQADHPAAEALRQLLQGDSPPSRPGWRVVVLSAKHALFLLPGLAQEGVSYWNAEFENREGSWTYVRSGQCDLQPFFSGIEPARWDLAPGEALQANTTTLRVLVTDRGCSSGQSPEGRIVPAAVIYDANSVMVIFGVKPLPGSQTCEPAPAAAVSLELREALGNRELLDGAVFPAEPRGRAR
jgi:hypothetical protein